MNVPFLDLKTPHLKLEEEFIAVFRDCLHNASFIGGKYVTGFEDEFAKFCGSKYCIGVNSGTDALRFALMAAGVGSCDEVITVPNTFIATTEAISQAGASIAFVDIDKRTYNLDPNRLEDYLKKRYAKGTVPPGPKPKAVIPVHLYGQPADMDSILEIAGRYDLIVIEDSCQAHGAEYYLKKEKKWRKTGSLGLAAAFSFYPGKNLGACGEGGAVTTNDESIANKIRMIRDHGQAKKYYHNMEGYNGRLDSIQAGLLSIKLKYLPEWNEKRRQNALHYTRLLSSGFFSGDVITPPYAPQWARPVYHLYIARVSRREELQKHLQNKGIGTGLHYPVPVHLQKAYSCKGYKEGDFSITEKISSEILSLPMFPDLTGEQIEYVVKSIAEFYTKS